MKSQGFRRMENGVRCCLSPWSWSLLEHPLAEGINTGLIPEEVVPVTKEGKAAILHLKISLHPSGNGLSGACGPENELAAGREIQGNHFRCCFGLNPARGGGRAVEWAQLPKDVFVHGMV